LDAFASFFSLVGVTMVMQPDFIFGGHESETPSHAWAREIGTACCLISAFIQACTTIAVRQIGKRGHFLVFVFYLGVAGTILGTVGLFASGHHAQLPVNAIEWASLASVGLFSFMGQVLLNAGLQNAPAGPASLMRNIDVICAFVYGVVLFDEIPDNLSLGGAGLILSCLLLLAVSKWPRK
jgi:drug/metabolite transporter (DMT)-like permease